MYQVFALLAIVVTVSTNRECLVCNSNNILPSAKRNNFLYKSFPNHEHFPSLASEHKDCPTWMYRTNYTGECICGVDDYHAVKCDQSTGKVFLLDSHRMTYDRENQEVVMGASLHGISTPNDSYYIYHEVPMNKSQLNEAMCGPFSRKGRLCGECKEGYSPLVYSYNISCRKCSEEESKQNILKFIVVTLIPLTTFYLIVVLFKFNANSPKLHGFILFAQLISAPFHIRILLANEHDESFITGIKVLATLYGIWNLDFFRTLYPDMCLKLTTLQVLSLDYIIAIYPILLMLLTLIIYKLLSCDIMTSIWHPLKKCLALVKKDWSGKASMIDVFATFLLLAYGRVTSVSFNLLIYTSVVNSRGVFRGRYLYYDSTYNFFGKDHLPYGVLALIMLTCFNILPVLLLFCYPMKWFQKFLNHFKLSHLALHTFVDSFAGCYKDGTEPGTRDCRYFAGLYLVIRIAFYVLYEVVHTDFFYGISAIVISTVLLLYAIFQPYKSRYAMYNKVTLAMLTTIVIVIASASNVIVAYNKMYQATTFSIALTGIIAIVPQLYIIIAIKWMGFCSLIKLLRLIMKMKKSQPSSEVSALIEGNGETAQSLYDAVSLSREKHPINRV